MIHFQKNHYQSSIKYDVKNKTREQEQKENQTEIENNEIQQHLRTHNRHEIERLI